MKHLLMTICAVFFSFTAAVAQDIATKEKKATTETKKLSSAEKKEADLLEAFKTAGITAEEQVKVRVIVDESTAFYKALKADKSLSEEDLKAKSKEYSNDVRNPKLKEVIGEAKSKALREAQKAQKEAAAAAKQ